MLQLNRAYSWSCCRSSPSSRTVSMSVPLVTNRMTSNSNCKNQSRVVPCFCRLRFAYLCYFGEEGERQRWRHQVNVALLIIFVIQQIRSIRTASLLMMRFHCSVQKCLNFPPSYSIPMVLFAPIFLPLARCFAYPPPSLSSCSSCPPVLPGGEEKQVTPLSGRRGRLQQQQQQPGRAHKNNVAK